MPNAKATPVFWTERSLKNAISIKTYLLTHFSDKEVIHFHKAFESFEALVATFPELYPQSFAVRNILGQF